MTFGRIFIKTVQVSILTFGQSLRGLVTVVTAGFVTICDQTVLIEGVVLDLRGSYQCVPPTDAMKIVGAIGGGLLIGRSGHWQANKTQSAINDISDLLYSNGNPKPAATIHNTMTKSVARAFRWQRPLENWTYTCLDDIAQSERIGASFVSRYYRLVLLAPNIVEAILDGKQPAELTLKSLLKNFPITWNGQRDFLGVS